MSLNYYSDRKIIFCNVNVKKINIFIVVFPIKLSYKFVTITIDVTH